MIYQTHYEVLQVARSASPEVIQAAYESLSQFWHPDRNPDRRPEAEYRTKGIALAYEVLSDPMKRAAYDSKMDAEAKAEPRPELKPELNPAPKQESEGQPESASGFSENDRWMVLAEANSPAISQEQTLLEGIGIETLGGVFTKIFSPGQSVPCVAYQTFSTADDYQEALAIHLLRGVSEHTSQNHSLGMYEVTGIAPQPRGIPQVTLRFQVVGGGIYVEVVDVDGSSNLSIWRKEKENPVPLRQPKQPWQEERPLSSSRTWEDDFGLTGISNSPSRPRRLKPNSMPESSTELMEKPQPEASVGSIHESKQEKKSSISFTATQWLLCLSIAVILAPSTGNWPAIIVAVLIGAILGLFEKIFDCLPVWSRVTAAVLSFFVLLVAVVIGPGVREGRISLGASNPSAASAPLGYRSFEGELDKTPGYTWLNVKDLVRIEIPSDWSVGDEQRSESIRQWSEAVSGLINQHKSSLSVQSSPVPSTNFVRISFLPLEPPIDQRVIRDEVRANPRQLISDLSGSWNAEAPAMWEAMAKMGVRQVGQPSFDAETLGGQTALVIRYGRTVPDNPAVTMRVEQYHVVLGAEKALITLSYVDGDPVALAALQRVKSSIIITTDSLDLAEYSRRM